MTIDEAIKHCEEVAEKNEVQAEKWQEEGGEEWGKTIACRECAEDHRQLAKWLTDLKEAKRLLKAAVEDVAALAKAFNNDEPCGSFTPCSECPFDSPKGYCMEWRFKAEALDLIGGED